MQAIYKKKTINVKNNWNLRIKSAGVGQVKPRKRFARTQTPYTAGGTFDRFQPDQTHYNNTSVR